MEFKWRVTIKWQETEVGQNSTPKMTIVVEEITDKQYKDSLAFDFIGDEKVANARSVNAGDEVTVLYNTTASEYNWKIYNNIKWWQIRVSKKTEEKPVKDGGNFGDNENLPF